MADERLIVALDVSAMDEVKKLVEEIGDTVVYYKVGMELFYAVGAEVITYLKGQGKKIFLDLKLHDIPNTVAKSLRVLTSLGVDMINVHATGGAEMMKKAAAAIQDEAVNRGIEPPKIVAVTILTSTSKEQWKEMGYQVDLDTHVIHLAKLAQRAGLDGVVASPMEAQTIRETCGKDFLIVTPGVRPIGAAINDQSRITTPSIALESGSTHLVVGRPIYTAMNPRHASENILKEMESVHI
ncbi:orotidine-5'-phosphate decarboxylase [Selenomonas sp. TAMA-11512]|uniref:orotidine-5'-phosphate decarboxylase n=1 Tax=Selenomonas sp. TAMA-11512 TaxID=3095337 RepID=UPI00308A48C7|nr:orotidine-5'-phosphate decarboxylase [Selenomonas sp. TAMA-11512]